MRQPFRRGPAIPPGGILLNQGEQAPPQRNPSADHLLGGGDARRLHADDVCIPKPERGAAVVRVVVVDESVGGIAMMGQPKNWLILLESSGVYDALHGPVAVDIPIGSRLLMRGGYAISTNFDLPKGIGLVMLADIIGSMPAPVGEPATQPETSELR